MQRKKERSRPWWSRGVVIVLVSTAFFLWRSQRPSSKVAAQTDDTVIAFIGNLADTATASGQVVSLREASLAVSAPGRVTEVAVQVGDTVVVGDLLVQLETDSLTLSVANAEQSLRLEEANLTDLQVAPAAADIASAEAAVRSAQANLDDLMVGPSELDLAVYEANLRASEASLWSSSANLASSQNSIMQSQIDAARAAVASAEIQYDRAQEANEDDPNVNTDQAMRQAAQTLANAQGQLEELLDGPDTAASQSNVAAAAARLDGTQANYNLQANGGSVTQIAAAESQLAQAQATLADLQEGVTVEQIASAEARVEQARLTLADAQEALMKASVVAPFDGVVTAVYVSDGEIANSVVVELADMSGLEVVLSVDEVDVGVLAVGQTAVLNLETWPDTDIVGEISAISPNATVNNNATVTYDVHISLGESELPILLGMTANADLITAEKENVLLIPNAAIMANRAQGTYSVNRVHYDADGNMTTETVAVTIGLRDSQFTEITSGLNEDEEVLIRNTAPVIEFGGPAANEGE
jgi:HlyD family secretion protein